MTGNGRRNRDSGGIAKDSTDRVGGASGLTGRIKFELKSALGRRFLNRRPPAVRSRRRLLHLGCGDHILPGWVNADFFRSVRVARRTQRIDWQVDLRYPLNCEDNHWDGVFTEHTLEHLSPFHAVRLLREIYRTLKPGGWLRVTVPDLGKYVDYYAGKKHHVKFDRWPTGAEAIGSLTQSMGHLSVWDRRLLGGSLREAGFMRIREVRFGEGTDGDLVQDMECRRWETLYMEARKEPARG